MKYSVLVCFLAMIFSDVVSAQESSPGLDSTGQCHVWGRIVAPQSVLQNGLRIKLEGNHTAPQQKTTVADGTFEFASRPAGLYRFQVLDQSGRAIIKQAVHLTGIEDRVILHVPLTLPKLLESNTVSMRKLRRQLPREAVEAFRAGEKAERDGSWALSIANFEKAAAMAPHFTEAEANASVGSFRAGRLNDAMLHARKAYESDPEVPTTGYNFVTLLLGARRYREAESVLRSMLRTMNQLTELSGLLATSLAGQGHIDEALAALRRAVADFPEHRLLVADSLVNIGRPDLATMQVQEYMRSGTSECERLYLEGWMAEKIGPRTRIAAAH
jgi:tetratricopeptide (TPR) repeat protein